MPDTSQVAVIPPTVNEREVARSPLMAPSTTVKPLYEPSIRFSWKETKGPKRPVPFIIRYIARFLQEYILSLHLLFYGMNVIDAANVCPVLLTSKNGSSAIEYRPSHGEFNKRVRVMPSMVKLILVCRVPST